MSSFEWGIWCGVILSWSFILGFVLYDRGVVRW